MNNINSLSRIHDESMPMKVSSLNSSELRQHHAGLQSDISTLSSQPTKHIAVNHEMPYPMNVGL